MAYLKKRNEMDNAILKKRHPEKIKVAKKHHNIEIQSLDAGKVFFANVCIFSLVI